MLRKIISLFIMIAMLLPCVGCKLFEKNETLLATIVEINGSSVLVEPIQTVSDTVITDKISFNTSHLDDIHAEVGSIVEITYNGEMLESYPAQITALKWKIADDIRDIEYTGQWIDEETKHKVEQHTPNTLRIDKIYANCFFASPAVPGPYQFKINGTLSEEFCVDDYVECVYTNAYWDEHELNIEADLVSINTSDWKPDPYAAYKPVIYLYPQTKQTVTVRLDLQGTLTCTYPKYNNGWSVTAHPDGTLTDANGQTYNYLYWEGETSTQYDMTKGFCIKGKDTAAFLEEALEKLGLNRKEANEFIVYWLPQMENNPYNVIAFQTDCYTDAANLQITPAPDTLIRIFMTWQKAETFSQLPPQELTAPSRNGFTVVEWGGTQLTH